MPDLVGPQVAIVDYGMGNLFSVKHACEQVGLTAHITGSPRPLLEADAVILPGIGAFADAMVTLERLDLVAPLQDIARSGKPLVGVCLGMQLLMTGSHEFGWHQGLGVIEGEVLSLRSALDGTGLKVPHVGWNQVYGGEDGSQWAGSLLDGVTDGEFMYFVHSFYVKPARSELVSATTRYGPVEFCSSLRWGGVFACQFHPERSGPAGLRLYANLAASIVARTSENVNARETRREIRTA